MTQRILLTLLVFLTIVCGCDRATTPESSAGVVSLSPAATDLLLAIGAQDDLRGVSTFDTDARVQSLPSVGDYENVDWERIAALRPKAMIVQIDPSRMPPGMNDRAKSLNIELTSVRINRLTDVIIEIDRLGSITGREQSARAFMSELRDRLDDVRLAHRDSPKVLTLLVTSEDGLGVAAKETFLNDLLELAGGENAAGDRRGYVTLDRELIFASNAQAVVQLLPGATAQQVEAAQRFWQSMPDLPAVKSNRILIVTEPWSLVPGSHVADLAEKIAAHLHGPRE